jgi:hypothetical protein
MTNHDALTARRLDGGEFACLHRRRIEIVIVVPSSHPAVVIVSSNIIVRER